MGGWERTKRTRSGGRGRPVPRACSRRAALLLAFGVLLGALFLCARPGETHAPAPLTATAPAGTTGAVGAVGTAGAPHAVCDSPHDLPGCSPRAHLTPAVLPAPAPAVAVPDAAAALPALPARTGALRPPGPPARAPDLHALQVLRT
ncbi:hypothetical protein OG590_25155 [Streptomyces goshikiensis]|uniref:hypothetical protein n=1 Tax=Streptomyces TaxID=1883 RepID=UPI00069E7123|nr:MULTISPECIES: hypothetical protein [Streptomyces]WSR98726.1 hypothetical protein OG224_11985 [Streptomyces goshikiensis]WSY00242.1 hypothetical protein OG590_25155 [Streptomyces goshikiensis]